MGRLHLTRLAPRFGILAACALAAGACGSAGSASGPAAAPAQWHGQHSRVTTATHRLLRDEPAWAAFWVDVGQPAPRAPQWSREMAVAVFLGERRTGGYALRIEHAAPEDGRLVVTCRESTPPPGTMVTQALTQPWAVTVIPRTDLPVSIRFLDSPRPRPAQK